MEQGAGSVGLKCATNAEVRGPYVLKYVKSHPYYESKTNSLSVISGGHFPSPLCPRPLFHALAYVSESLNSHSEKIRVKTGGGGPTWL